MLYVDRIEEQWSKLDEISMEDLIADHVTFRDTHSKATAILKGLAGITSMAASCTMMHQLLRSDDGLSTTQHRLLFGLCISDIFFSFHFATFNLMAPSDVNYMIWNARGNEVSCTVQGFLAPLGGLGGLYYNTCLCLFFVAVVKYNKSDDYIRTKIEPFLHTIPILMALTISITGIVMKQYNVDARGNCQSPYHYPPHCMGYHVGDVRDGFDIPCGRGLINEKGNENEKGSGGGGGGGNGAWMFHICRMVLVVIPVVTMITSLTMIHRTVRKQERKLARYGIGSLRGSLSAVVNHNHHDREHGHDHGREHEHEHEHILPRHRSSINAGVDANATTTTRRRQSMLGSIRTSVTAAITKIKISSPRTNNASTPTPTPAATVRTRSNGNARSQSRAVMHKAFGYTLAWFVSYGAHLLSTILEFATAGDDDDDGTNSNGHYHHGDGAGWSFLLVLVYVASIFLPLQGLFNLLIFMYPKIVAIKNRNRNRNRNRNDQNGPRQRRQQQSHQGRGGRAQDTNNHGDNGDDNDVSWCQAFAQAFRSNDSNDNGNGNNMSGNSGGRRKRRRRRSSAATSGNIKKKQQRLKQRGSRSLPSSNATSPPPPPLPIDDNVCGQQPQSDEGRKEVEEEEKREIQVPQEDDFNRTIAAGRNKSSLSSPSSEPSPSMSLYPTTMYASNVTSPP